MANNNTFKPETSMVRVELGYCPRCGMLRAHLAGAAAEVCETCERIFQWISTGCERPLRRRRRRRDALQGGRT